MSRFVRAFVTAVVLYVAYSSLYITRVTAQNGAPDGSQLRVFLMTVEAGTEIWEKFGHDAIWIVNSETGEGLSYNYGIFDMQKPGFMLNFLRGRMWYSMDPRGPIPPEYELSRYANDNRTGWVQELNLTAAQKAQLRDFLAWNNLPQNMTYRYDYFRDNCTTRIRDALDRVLGGQLHTALAAQPVSTTYRWQARRLLSVMEPAYAGIELAMGHPVDLPLTKWEDAFLPGELMKYIQDVQVRGESGDMVPLVMSTVVAYRSTRAPMPAAPPDRRLPYTAIGVLFGVMFLLLARLVVTQTSMIPRVLFLLATAGWSLVVGVFGLVSMLLWFATDHTVTRANENLLQANIFSLILAVLLVVLVLGGRADLLTLRTALLVAGLSALGFVMQVLPGLDQFNGEIIGLLLPSHLALAVAVWWIAKNGTRLALRGDGKSDPHM
jgi:hypothetical protein